MKNDIKFNLIYEQYLLNELDSKKKENLEKDSSFLENIGTLSQDNSDFFNKFDIKKLAKDTESKMKDKGNIYRFHKKVITSIGAIAATLIISFSIFPQLTNNEVILLKGAQKLNIYVRKSDEIEKLRDNDSAHMNNQLQITYLTKNNYGLIFSIDGLNNVTFHYPENLHSPTNLDAGKEVSLPTSYTLDNAPYFEKFYLVTSKDSFDLKFVQNAIKNITISNGSINEDLQLPSKYYISTITLRKE